MRILGISCFYHDAAAALLVDGKFAAAAQEERFTRTKHDPGFPKNAIDFCLDYANLKPEDLDAVAFYDKPFLKFERILMTALNEYPKGIFSFVPAMRTWLGQKLWIKQLIYEQLPSFNGPLYFPEHHMSHAASAFLVSPFRKAAILTVDGVGEWATATRGIGEKLDITLTHEIDFPHSLGLLYSAFTYYLGFKVNSAEYKVMGLATYGEPNYAQKILDNLIDVKQDGSFRLNMSYFAYPYAEVMTSPRFHDLFGGDPRPLESKPGKREMDLASSLQKVLEEILVRQALDLYNEHRTTNLCMAGGVALNCVANEQILKKTPFTDLFIQPAAGDAGGAVGAAAYVYHTLKRNPRRTPTAGGWKNAYLGPEYDDEQIKAFLDPLHFRYKKLPRSKLIHTIVDLIEAQQVIGLFRGRMEFGPRALGNRSILADARNPENQDRVNLKIKFRESFRPFAPSILEEDAEDWFDLPIPSPYMLLTALVKKGRVSPNHLVSGESGRGTNLRRSLGQANSLAGLISNNAIPKSNHLRSSKFPSRDQKNKVIPAVVHVDNSARIQTITKKDNPFYWEVINEFKRRTGVPVIINTSFNQRGEPIVESPKNAFNCFLRTDMDHLVMGSFLLNKQEMPQDLIENARQHTFELD